ILMLQKILRMMAVLVLKKYKPKIVGITGSVGKTSTKEATFSVLESKFRVRRTNKNYNNEIGLPLTIIGADSGEDSLWRWLMVFLKWFWIILAPIRYPEVLVLEMGADRPGDMRYLTGFIRPDVAVITDVSSSHMEFFKNIEGVAKEKSVLVKELSGKGLAVVNADNPYLAKINPPGDAVTFGFSEEAQMRATDISFSYADDYDEILKGLSFKLNYKGTTIPVRLNNVLARHQIYSALAATAVGTGFGINLVEAGAALENFSLPYGRMNLIVGIKNSSIIDDTYNSSPTSALAALDALGEIAASGGKYFRKIAVLGDMLELGGESAEKHGIVGRKFLEIKGDLFFAVGKRMQSAVDELRKNGFPQENIYHFESPVEAGEKVREIIQEGDLVLVKGSQGMRMEKVVEAIMADPAEAEKLLCRQSQHWREIPWKSV
ncbi:MAG: Mur ligase family protein, partial [Candidatus Moranbacteria bacterium]|nr:Mur ligase family protein [Candidatus Moranbacteria bacterium]